jgi:hypothetical protein
MRPWDHQMLCWKPIDTRKTITTTTTLAGSDLPSWAASCSFRRPRKGGLLPAAIIQANLVGNILWFYGVRSVTLYDLTAKSCVVSPRPFQPFDLNSNVPDLLTYNSVLEIVRSVCVLLLVCASRFSSAFVAPLFLSLSLSREDHAKQHPW